MAERRMEKRLDERIKAYVLTDGKDYPRKFEELNPHQTPVNIRDISYCVKKTVQSLFNEMDDQITMINDWVSLDDDDVDLDYLEDEEEETDDTEEEPKKVRFPGRIPKQTRRPIQNFLSTFCKIKWFQSDAELQREEDAIRKLVEMNPDRPVQIHSMGSLLRHLVCDPGVTVPPCDIIKYLNVENVRTMHESYMDHKEVLNRALEERGNHTRSILDHLHRFVRNINAKLRDHQETYQNLDANILKPGNIITKRRNVENIIVFGNKTFQKMYKNFCKSYLGFRMLNDDSFRGLHDYLETMASCICELNPTKSQMKQSASSFL